jgi:hypothetical protein
VCDSEIPLKTKTTALASLVGLSSFGVASARHEDSAHALASREKVNVMSKRWAFVGLALLTGGAVARCGASTGRPNVEVSNDNDSGSTPVDSGGVTHFDATPPADTGTPGITLGSQKVDFGLVPCGGQGQAQFLELTNTGTAELTVSFNLLQGGQFFSASFSAATGDAGAVTSATIPPGQKASLRIQPSALPQTADVTKDHFTDVLALSTSPAISGLGPDALNITLTETAKGAILKWSASALPFGTQPLNAPVQKTFTAQNVGNDGAQLFYASSSSAFAVSALGPIAVGAGSTADDQLTFTPINTAQQTGTVTMTADTSTVLCAPLPAPLQYSGQGTSGAPVVSPSLLLFGPNGDGLVNCGTQAASLPITIQNLGSAAFDFTATFTLGGANYTLFPANGKGTVQPGSTPGTITVIPNPVPKDSDVTPGLYNGILSITTTAPGDAPHIVQLQETAQGAIIQSTYGGGTLGFPDTPNGQTSSNTFSIQNIGNVSADVGVNLAAGPFGFSLSQGQTFPVTIAPQSAAAVTASFSPTSVQPYSQVATLTPTATAFCKPLSPAASQIALKGTGTPAPPLGLGMSKTSIDFGQVPCGNKANDISVAINNTGQTPFSWTSVFRNGGTSQFTLTPSSGQILAGGSQTVTVSMSSVPNPGSTATDFYSDTLHVQATANAGTASLDVPVHLTGYGAILRFSPTAVDFGNVPQGTVASSAFNILNQGNAPAEVDLDVTNGAGSTSQIARTPLGPITVNGGSSSPLSATFTANDTAAQTGSFAMSSAAGSSNYFCAALPAPMTLKGTGSSTTVGVSDSTVVFSTDPVNNPGFVNCGTQAQPKLITLTATGNNPFNWTASLTSGGSFYTLSATSGTVNANSTGTFSIIPKAIPSTSDVTANVYGGTVQITTNAQNDTPHLIQLSETAYGAIMSWTLSNPTDFGNQTVGQSATAGFSVTNKGNAPASVSFTNGNSAFNLTSLGTVGASSTKSAVLSFDPTLAQPYTDTATMTVQSTALCGALPGAVTLKGTGVNPAPPVLSVPQSISFGSVACGYSKPISVPIAVKNGGTNPFFVSASLLNPQDKRFTISVPATQVPAGGQTTATVTLPQMDPYASVTADALGDTVVLTAVNGSLTATANVTIHITASGAILRYSPTGLNFGIEPVNSSTKLPFSVYNDGNLAAEVDLELDGTSSGTFTRAPLGFVTVNGGANQGLNATFAPTANDTTQQSGNLVLTPTSNPNNVLCQPAPQPLSMIGTGSTSTTVVSPSQLDFGLTNCGATAGSQKITITNNASAGSPIPWSASFTAGGNFYTLSASSGQVAAGSTASFDVIPQSIPSTSQVTNNLYGATLKVVSGPNNDTQLIPITQTAHGVILAATGNGATNFTALNFGGVSVNQTATTQFTFTNNGNADLPLQTGTSGITLANTNAVFAVNPNPPQGQTAQSLAFGLTQGQSKIVTVNFTPAAVQTYNDTATYTLALPPNTVLCQAAPPNFTLNGTGNTGVGVSPTNLNFGLVQCQSAPPSGQTVTITNKGGDATWSGVFGRGTQNLPSYYALQDSGGNPISPGQSQPLAAGSSVTIFVVPNKISTPASTTADGFSDTLTITTTATGDSPHVVSLHETAQGAFLSFSPSPIQSNPNGIGVTNPVGFTVANSGNLAASYLLSTVITQGNDTKVGLNYPTPTDAAAPFFVNLCSTYSTSSPYPNQCPPPQLADAGNSCKGSSIVLPEFCMNFAGGNVFAGQTQTGVLEGTGYPRDLGFTQAFGYIQLTPDPSAVLCSDPVPNVPLSETSFQ